MPNLSSQTLTLPRGAAPLLAPRPWLALLALIAGAVLAGSVLVPGLPPAPAAGVTNAASSGPALTSEPAEAHISEFSSTIIEAPATEPIPAPARPVAIAAAPSAPKPEAVTSLPAAAPAPAAIEAPAPSQPSRPGERWAREGFAFVVDGQEWDSPSFGNVDAALARIPARIRAQLGNRSLGEVQILVNRSGRTLSGKQPYGGAANFFSTNDVRNELVLFPGQSVLTIMHELGHAHNLRHMAPGRYAIVLIEPEMQSFMAATGWKVLSTLAEVRAARDHTQVQVAYTGQQVWPRLSNDDPLEDYANSFALYFFAPEDLRTKSPERFAWFEANLGR